MRCLRCELAEPEWTAHQVYRAKTKIILLLQQVLRSCVGLTIELEIFQRTPNFTVLGNDLMSQYFIFCLANKTIGFDCAIVYSTYSSLASKDTYLHLIL